MTLNEGQIGQSAEDRVQARRDEAERILALAEHLAKRDRLLLEQVFRDGRTIVEVARLTRVNPRTLQHHVAKLIKHLNSNDFRFIAAQLELLPRELHPVARRAFLQSRSIRDTARLTRRSVHQVRADRTRIKAIIQSHQQVAEPLRRRVAAWA